MTTIPQRQRQTDGRTDRRTYNLTWQYRALLRVVKTARKTAANEFENLINHVLSRIFSIHDSESITHLRSYLCLVCLDDVTDGRRLRFTDRPMNSSISDCGGLF